MAGGRVQGCKRWVKEWVGGEWMGGQVGEKEDKGGVWYQLSSEVQKKKRKITLSFTSPEKGKRPALNYQQEDIPQLSLAEKRLKRYIGKETDFSCIL